MNIRDIKKKFGFFRYTEGRGGRIKIDKRWIRNNIYILSPIFFRWRVEVHKRIAPQLLGALLQIHLENNLDLIRTFDGCFVPRHQIWLKDKPLSHHSWGVAFDINARTNHYGQIGDMPSELIRVFKAWGFRWGGTFRIPDWMHFEIENLFPDDFIKI